MDPRQIVSQSLQRIRAAVHQCRVVRSFERSFIRAILSYESVIEAGVKTRRQARMYARVAGLNGVLRERIMVTVRAIVGVRGAFETVDE